MIEKGESLAISGLWGTNSLFPVLYSLKGKGFICQNDFLFGSGFICGNGFFLQGRYLMAAILFAKVVFSCGSCFVWGSCVICGRGFL